jgi:DNA-directed RNA polymerase subunit beta
LIRQKVVEGLEESFPIQSRNKTIEVGDLRIMGKDYSPSEQKKAILTGDSLFESVKGTVRMKDKDGKVIDEMKNFTLVRVPYFTPRHTFILGGNEHSMSNMVRRKPGVYSRKRANGILEAGFNTLGGSNFKVSMDPAKGQPQLEYYSTKIPLYPVLRRAGVSHDQIAKSWGSKLADANAKALEKKGDKSVDKLYNKEVPTYARDASKSPQEKMKDILERYKNAKMDPAVNQQTIGRPHTYVSPDSLLDASSKVLKIFNNQAEVDDQDNLGFKTILSVDDFFKERIKLHARDVAKKAAIKMESTPNLKKAMPSGPFTKDLLKFISSTTLSSIPDQTNPVDLIDSAMRVTSLGEGGISTERAIPIEARQTHVTQMGALDPIRTPESMRAGIDIRAAVTAQKDDRGDIYVPVYDVKTKREKYVKAGDLQTSVLMFPNQPMKGKVDAVENGVVRRVPFSKVNYQIPHQSRMYSPTTNLIPFLESAQGNRAVMGSKMQVQALSLVEREAPYVQVATPSGSSFENMIGRIINPHSPVAGVVKKIDDDYIYIQPDKEKTAAKGNLVKVPYDKNFPLAAKTYLNHELEVKAGDRVKAKQRLGNSNFTRDGRLALGKNMSVAFMPYYGANSNDAVVISDAAAKKFTSERMYKVVVPRDPDLTFNQHKHKTYYGHNYTKDQYRPLDKDGVVAPGTRLLPGDPVIVGVRKTELSPDDLILGKLHKSLAHPHREFKQGWEHDHEGEVVDVVKTPKRITLTIKTKEPAGIGDKIAGRYGNKGVISEIVPTDQMVKDEAGKPIDVLMTSAGVVSRINPSQIIETAVGKVVEKTGKPIIVENFADRDNVKWAKDLLKKHKVKDKETVFDPRSGKPIPNVFVGRQYLYKLFKSTDTNYSARSTGTYDMNLQPTRGGTQGAKSIGKMEFDALLGHNARNILREAATVKSQKNDEFWRAVQLGQTPPEPKSTFAYDKFLGMLTGAGVRVNRDGSRMSLSPLTDKDVLEMSSGEVKDAKIVRAKDLRPEAGGLFDPGVTGGLRGTKWSHVALAEPVINPVFKEPVRRLLGMTNAQLADTMKNKGGAYIKKELGKIDLDEREKILRKKMKTRKADQLDNEVKQMKYIRALKEVGTTPDKAYVVSKVPVIPPVMRPIMPSQGGTQIIYGDTNPLYQDLVYINNQLKEVKKNKTLAPLGEAERLRPSLQQAVGAVYGTDEPATAKSKARKHKGFLTYISGVGGPKHGFFQSKIMSRSQDVAGRGTIVPDSTLGVDEVGVPKEMLWGMYKDFIIRRLVLKGFPATEANQMVEKRHMAAEEALKREIQERPVLLNRAPTLHRYNIVGANPVPVPGRTLRVNPFIEAGMNADYDGDTMMLHVPVGPKAVQEAKDITLSNLLFGDKSKSDLLVFPQHEAIMGIHHASRVDAKNKTPRKFKTKGQAVAAYKRGEIGLGTRVTIG